MAAASWTTGYVGDVPYMSRFYREMAPTFLDYACVINGFAGLGRFGGLRYCELGCGRGYGTAVLAAANPDCSFVGIDFNPAHIREARDFARLAGIENVAFLEMDFVEAAQSSDAQLDDFHVVAAHGVYSWVAPAVRESIHEFLRRKLAAGGLFYVSYNSLPGWSGAAPAQRLLREFAARATGDSLKRVVPGRAALKTLSENSSAFTEQNAAAKRRIALMDTQDPAYVAHEYLNEHWSPLYVTDVMAALGEAKLSYAGSATIGDNRLSFCATPELVPLVQAAPDIALRELLKDYVSNKQFRRDVYVKGGTRIIGGDLDRRYEEIAFALTNRPKGLPENWPIPRGSAQLGTKALELIFGMLEKGPATGAELRAEARRLGLPGVELPAVLEVLIHNGAVNPCRPDFATVDTAPARRLNEMVFESAFTRDGHQYLASPVLGSAIPIQPFERMAGPVAIGNHGTSDPGLAAMLFDRFEARGVRITRDGKPLERSEATTAEIAASFHEFRDRALPRWRALGIAP
jgi:trans-aconitate methyltransferase